MEPRLAAGVLVSALIRRMEAAGGSGMVLAKGDATAGAILIQIADRGKTSALLERTLGPDGYAWRTTGPADLADPMALADYLARRRRRDPDLWIVELDGADAERLARDMLGG